MRSFAEKHSRNGEIVLSFTDVGKTCPNRENMSFNSIRENKFLAKISDLQFSEE